MSDLVNTSSKASHIFENEIDLKSSCATKSFEEGDDEVGGADYNEDDDDSEDDDNFEEEIMIFSTEADL